ncbi:MAG TPA: hypothetical protein H9839_00855 [Candidatus Intestinimonas stercorigallinarum]|nr:hypothetical protein [Candidatus Intestinimonas stercorigallinarum]
MNRCPHTCFSTQFHTGKGLLRARLRALLAGPKRRGTAPLALALVLTLTAGSLAACVPASQPPELDLEAHLIRYPGEEDWTELPPLLPAPSAWAEQDLAGRDELDHLTGDLLGADPGLQAGFVDAENGWLTFSSTASLGPISDTCVYRTHDGGRTWEETACLTGGSDALPSLWFSVRCAAFLDNDRAVLCTGLFLDAPVFYTTDGGYTWQTAQLPDPDLAAETLSVEGDRLVMTARRCGDGGGSTLTLVSEDGGAVWTKDSPSHQKEA